MTDDTIYDHADPMFHESRVDEAFRDGAASMRELLARFVEQSGDTATAASIRLNWHPGFGADPGQIAGELPVDAWGMTQEMFERGRARTYAAIARAAAAERAPDDLRAEQQWQPIETSPKDGTRVLCYPTTGRYKLASVVYYKSPFGFVTSPGDWLARPTHWQPLPAPPQPR